MVERHTIGTYVVKNVRYFKKLLLCDVTKEKCEEKYNVEIRRRYVFSLQLTTIRRMTIELRHKYYILAIQRYGLFRRPAIRKIAPTADQFKAMRAKEITFLGESTDDLIENKIVNCNQVKKSFCYVYD